MKTQALHLDFVKAKPATRLGLALLLIALGLLLISVLQWLNEKNSLNVLQQQLALQQSKQEQLTAKRNDGTQPSDRFKLTNIDIKTPHYWLALLHVLEAKMLDGIALLSIRPDAEKGKLELTGEAQDYQTVLLYITQLSESKALQDVHLIKHEIKSAAKTAGTEDLAAADEPVGFVISAHWVKGM